MKAPNGYGAVTKLKGNRRRPYAVRKTMGWDGDRRIIKAMGYYATREEAMIALAEFNKSPYDLDARKITMAELFERWYKRTESQGRLSAGTLQNMRIAFKHCSSLHGIPYASIKAHMMQDCVDACKPGAQSYTRNLLYNLDKYAIELDIIKIGYSYLVHVATLETKERVIFSEEEVSRLWDNVEAPWVDSVLIYLYSGWRFSELLTLRTADVDIDARTMRGESKTAAGKNRIVPIHLAILH